MIKLYFAATGGAAFVAAGLAGGATGSAIALPIQSLGNHLYFNDPMMTAKQWITGVAIGAALGGTFNGTIAASKGNNFWTGKSIASGRGIFSFNNTPKSHVKVGELKTITNGHYSVNEHVKDINYGQQAKHIPNELRIEGIDYKGTRYIKGKSVLQVNPEIILDDVHSFNYEVISQSSRGSIIKLDYNVGIVINQETNQILGLTNMVMIRGNEAGLVHFIPYLPY